MFSAADSRGQNTDNFKSEENSCSICVDPWPLIRVPVLRWPKKSVSFLMRKEMSDISCYFLFSLTENCLPLTVNREPLGIKGSLGKDTLSVNACTLGGPLLRAGARRRNCSPKQRFAPKQGAADSSRKLSVAKILHIINVVAFLLISWNAADFFAILLT